MNGRTLLASIGSLLNGAADLFAPQTCLACAAHIPGDGPPLCGSCADAANRLRAAPACPRCGRNAIEWTIHDGRCRGCRSERFWNVGAVVRVAPDQPPIREMLRRLKYGGDLRQARALGGWLHQRLVSQPWFSSVDLLVPVPMHALRRWQRPCDHARVLTEEIAGRCGMPLSRAWVRRTNYSPSQTEMVSAVERFENIRGCFEARSVRRLRGRTVCVVDNVMVTGATLHEVSRVLRKAGAAKIYAAIIARAAAAGHSNPLPQIDLPSV